MIETTPYYQTTNAAQSKFFWGDRPLQTGDTFNAQTWNAVNAPQQAWGIQDFGAQTLGNLTGQMNPFVQQYDQAGMPVQNPLQMAPAQPLTPQEQAYLATLDPFSAQAFLRSKGLA
jgi:hypothetical protein